MVGSLFERPTFFVVPSSAVSVLLKNVVVIHSDFQKALRTNEWNPKQEYSPSQLFGWFSLSLSSFPKIFTTL